MIDLNITTNNHLFIITDERMNTLLVWDVFFKLIEGVTMVISKITIRIVEVFSIRVKYDNMIAGMIFCHVIIIIIEEDPKGR